MPGLVKVVFTDSGIDSQLQPFHAVLGGALDAHVVVSAVHNRNEVLPTKTVLEGPAAPAVRARAEPGEGIPPSALLHIFYADDRHTGLGQHLFPGIGDIAKRETGAVFDLVIEAPASPVKMFRRLVCQARKRPCESAEQQQSNPRNASHFSPFDSPIEAVLPPRPTPG